MFEIKTLTEPDNRLFLLIGPSGAGKTTLASLLNPPTLFIAYDPSGINVLRKVDYVMIDPARPWESTEEVLRQLPRLNSKYKTIVWDDLTAMSRLFLRQVVPEKDRLKPTHPQYGGAINRMYLVLNACKYDLTQFVHIWVSTDAVTSENQDDGIYTVPNVVGQQIKREIPQMVDNVFYLMLPRTRFVTSPGKPPEKRVERLLLTMTNGSKHAKNRVNAFGGPLVLEQEEPVGTLEEINKLRVRLWPLEAKEEKTI